jgi:hypothetical protein
MAGSGGSVSAESGGTSGAGGSTGASGGSAGNSTATPSFNAGEPFRFEMPCLYADGGGELGECNSAGQICWVAENDTPENPHQASAIITTSGDDSVVYRFTLRIRGVMEPKIYDDCAGLFSRETNPADESGQIYVCQGSESTTWPDTYNLWRLTVADPAQVYYLNANTEAGNHRVNTIDGEFEVLVRGGASLSVEFDDLNGGQIRNCSLVVPEIDPAPLAYDGNFVQLELVDWTTE